MCILSKSTQISFPFTVKGVNLVSIIDKTILYNYRSFMHASSVCYCKYLSISLKCPVHFKNVSNLAVGVFQIRQQHPFINKMQIKIFLLVLTLRVDVR